MIPEVHFLSKHVPSNSGTTQMRCHQPVEYLARKGWRAKVDTVYRALPSARRAVVFHRVIDDTITIRAMKIARAMNCPVLYDIDDFLFDDRGVAHLDKVDCAGKYRSASARSFRAAMKQADYVTCSTEFLRAHISTFHPRCIVMRNGLSQELVDLAAQTTPKYALVRDEVTLAYFAGSRHHGEDFAIVQPALLEVLRVHPNTRFLLMGPIQFDPAFRQFGRRFEHRDFVPYPIFIKMLAEADINLIPLDQSTPVSHARSELKFIEAGVFGVPSVASPTQSYTEVIRNGRNGVICADYDWYQTLSNMVENTEHRQRLGRIVQQDVLRDYGPENRAEDWGTLMHKLDKEILTAEPQKPVFPLKIRQLLAIQWRAARRRGKSVRSRFSPHSTA